MMCEGSKVVNGTKNHLKYRRHVPNVVVREMPSGPGITSIFLAVVAIIAMVVCLFSLLRWSDKSGVRNVANVPHDEHGGYTMAMQDEVRACKERLDIALSDFIGYDPLQDNDGSPKQLGDYEGVVGRLLPF